MQLAITADPTLVAHKKGPVNKRGGAGRGCGGEGRRMFGLYQLPVRRVSACSH